MNKKRFGIVAAVALVGLLLLLVARPRRPAGQEVATGSEDRGAAAASAGPRAQRPALAAQPAAGVIEAIAVEKTEVCSGEDNLVTITLAGGNAGDDTVRVMMPGLGVAGPQMPFRLRLTGDDKQQPEMPEVVVFGRDGVLATVKVPTIHVKDCDPGPLLTIDVALVANTSDTFAFTATVHNPGTRSFKPVEWHWDFGDGADATTKVRTVEHGYEDRPQTARISAFLVHVRAIDAQGAELVGRHGLELRNRAFEALRIKNAVLLSTVLTPRFPVMNADGRVAQRVRIHHAYDKPVTIERVFVQRFRTNEEGREEVQESEVDPRQILGTNVIPPGRGVEATATLDTRAEPGVGLVTFDLVGTSADGIRAPGQYSVLRPPELIPPDQRDIVTDARLHAEILAVRKILGRDEVTIDEIMRLRREGALDDLVPAPLEQRGAVAAVDAEGEVVPLAEPPKSRKGMPLRPPSTSAR